MGLSDQYIKVVIISTRARKGFSSLDNKRSIW